MISFSFLFQFVELGQKKIPHAPLLNRKWGFFLHAYIYWNVYVNFFLRRHYPDQVLGYGLSPCIKAPRF